MGEFILLGLFVVLAAVLRSARVRVWLLGCAQALVIRFGNPEHTPEWEREHAELWLMAHRRQLLADLRRVESLLLHDEMMSATRQVGNRLARDQLITLLAGIPDLLPAQDRYASNGAVAPLTYDLATPMSSSSSVEVLDVTGW